MKKTTIPFPPSLLVWGLLIIVFIAFSLFFPASNLIVLTITLAGALFLLFLRKPWLLFYTLGIILPLQFGIYSQALFGITFSPILLFSLYATIILILMLLRSDRFHKIPSFGWWLILVSITALSYAQNPSISNPVQGVWFIFRLAFVAPLIYPAYCWFVKKPEYTKKILDLLVITSAISGVIGPIQTISGGNLLSGVMTNGRYLGLLFKFPPEVTQESPVILSSHFYYQGIFRAHGTFYRVNGYAAFISTMAVFTWCLWRGAKGKKRLYLALAFIAQLSGVIVTLSRSAWLATLAGLGIAIMLEMLVIHRMKLLTRKNSRLLLIIGFLIGILLLIGSNLPTVSERFATFANIDQVAQVSWRIAIWNSAIQSILQHPWLGVGDSTVISGSAWYGSYSYGAHNLIIGIAYEQGIIALLIILYFLTRTLVSCWTWVKNAEKITEKVVAMGIIAAITAILVNGIGGALLDIENMGALLWLFIGIGITKVSQLPRNGKTQTLPE